MKKRSFWVFYAALTAIIIIFIDYSVVYVQKNIDEYEAYQPEHVLDSMMDTFKNAVANNSVSLVVTYPEIVLSELDNDWAVDSILTEYETKTSNVSEWKYGILSGSYSASKREYGIFGDGELIAKATLTSEREWPVLVDFLTVNEWKVYDIAPSLTYKKYECAVQVPKGYSVKVNDIELTEDRTDVEITEFDDDVLYRVSNLYSIPSVEASDANGNPCVLNETEGFYSADVTRYHMILPESYRVYENDMEIKGTPTDYGTLYRFASIFDSLTIYDAYGQSVEYRNGDSIGIYDVSFCVPSNFEVLFMDKDASGFIVDTYENDQYKLLKNIETVLEGRPAKYEIYEHMPLVNKYTISNSIVLPKLQVYDNNGSIYPVEFVNNRFEVSTQVGKDEIPEDILKEINPLEVAKLWSLYMTDDIGGKNHGYAQVEAMLLPDTKLYKSAYDWYRGVDITFVSTHTSTVFEDERMDNYVRYSDNLFSCDVSLNKIMYLVTNTHVGDVSDKINSTFYFYKYNDTWKLLTFIDKS